MKNLKLFLQRLRFQVPRNECFSNIKCAYHLVGVCISERISVLKRAVFLEIGRLGFGMEVGGYSNRYRKWVGRIKPPAATGEVRDAWVSGGGLFLAWMAGVVADGCGGAASRRVSLL